MQSTTGSRAVQQAREQKKSKKRAEPFLHAALAAYRDGRHVEVQSLCWRALLELPSYFDAMHLMGMSLLDCGKFEDARLTLERAIALEPGSAEAHGNLGFALFNLARYREAQARLEKAVSLRPVFSTAHRNLGDALLRQGLAEQAIAAYDRAIQQNSEDADALCNRGVAEMALRRYQAAVVSAERALTLRPRHFEALVGKGLAHLELRHYEVAEDTLNAALAINPRHAELLAHRGRLHMLAGRQALAEADFDAAIAIDPSLEVAWRGKAQVCMLIGNVAQAVLACSKVLERNSNSELGFTLLGACYGRLGQTAAAIQHFDRAIEIKSDCEEAISKKIFYLDFLPEAGFEAQQAARKYWWEMVGSRLPRRQLAARTLDPDKRVVVGYVSSDFRTHSAAFAFFPVLKLHDKTKFQINCYSSSPARDALTDVFQSMADVWVDAQSLSDDELADRIEADAVDILVDLSGHTTGARMGVFARKPAPIQVSAWGSGTGTGLRTMDYLFSNPVTIPHHVRHLFTERVHDLPAAIIMDPIYAGERGPPPMLRNGFVTFGAFNRIDKISEGALAVWSKILQAVSGSKIVIKSFGLNDPFLHDELVGRFVAHGVSRENIICLGASERRDHLLAFETIDISLDPFPQNGGISTWESLYMGVPVIAKLGNGVSSRAAATILEAIGLHDWVASDDDEYVAIAQKFAAMPEHLQTLRADLPAIIASSPAGNPEAYTREVEAGYRQFWRHYCSSRQAEPDITG